MKKDNSYETASQKRGISFRIIFLFFLFLGFSWFLTRHISEAKPLFQAFLQGKKTWIVVALLLQIAYWSIFSETYRKAFSLTGIQRKWSEYIPLSLVIHCINILIPTGATSGIALLTDDSAKRGYSPSRAATAGSIQLTIDLFTIMVFALMGILFLFIHHALQIYEITGICILTIFVGILFGILFLGAQKPKTLEKLFLFGQQTTQKIASLFGKHSSSDSSEKEWILQHATEFSDAAHALLSRPKGSISLFLLLCSAYLMHLATLAVLFLAFDAEQHLSIIFTGLAMGLLFWIVSPVPGGIGFVEGAMILSYTSLGVPLHIATIVSILFRGLAFWLPFLIGFALLPTIQSFSSQHYSSHGIWHVRIIAFLVALMGIIDIVSAIIPTVFTAQQQTIDRIDPLLVHYGGHLTALLSGFALLILFVGIQRRKRVAFYGTIIILFFSSFGHILKGFDYLATFFGMCLGVWMLFQQQYFTVRSDKPSFQKGFRAFAISSGFTFCYGVLGFYLLDTHFSVHFHFREALWQTIVMFTRFYNPEYQPIPITSFGQYFISSLYIIGAVTFFYAIFSLLRPVLSIQTSFSDTEKVSHLISQYGKTGLASMALLNDKTYFFGSENSVIAYAVHHRVALALGDPIGPNNEASETIQKFQNFCEKNDWIPTFYQVRDEYKELYEKHHCKLLKIGHEGIVDLLTFSLEGKHGKTLRSTMNQMTRAGYSTKILYPPHDAKCRADLQKISDHWLTKMHGKEKHFSLGWFEEEYLQRSPLLVAYDMNTAPVAFVNILIIPATNEVSADLMRYLPEIHGIMDFLFLSLLEWAKSENYRSFSFGSSPLSGVGEEHSDPYAERFLHFAYEHLNRFYNFKGVHAFKSKFHPEWFPRFLVYPKTAFLPTIALALHKAINGGLLPKKFSTFLTKTRKKS